MKTIRGYLAFVVIIGITLHGLAAFMVFHNMTYTLNAAESEVKEYVSMLLSLGVKTGYAAIFVWLISLLFRRLPSRKISVPTFLFSSLVFLNPHWINPQTWVDPGMRSVGLVSWGLVMLGILADILLWPWGESARKALEEAEERDKNS